MPKGASAYSWELGESILGLLAVFIIGFAPLSLGLLFGLMAWMYGEDAPDRIPLWLGALVLAVEWTMAVWLAYLASRTFYMCYPEWYKLDQKFLQGQGPPTWTPLLPKQTPERTSQPMAVALGLNLPRIPRLLAPLVSLWWLFHFGIGVAACLLVDVWIEHVQPDAPAVFKFLVPQAIGFPFTFACNVYLLLAVAVWVNHQSVLTGVWRWRLLIDIAVTVIPFLIATFAV